MKQCLNPIFAVRLWTDKETKKENIKFLPIRDDVTYQDLKDKYGNDLYLLPCGSCESCRINYAENWAIRCTLEAQYHKYNYFITLTYRSPFDKFASMKDLKKFFDRLSGKGHKNSFMYFSCFEHGKLTNRPHFHIVLFSDFPLDLYDQTKLDGIFYYHSKLIGEKWSYGLHNVAPFESSCARYVAKYACKAHGSQISMSRNIGKKYFLEHFNELIKDGFKVYGDFGNDKFSTYMPPVFIRWFKDINPDLVANYKEFKNDLARVVSVYNLRNIGTNNLDIVSQSLRVRQLDKLSRNKERLL